MARATGEADRGDLRVDFDTRLKLKSRVTSDAARARIGNGQCGHFCQSDVPAGETGRQSEECRITVSIQMHQGSDLHGDNMELVH